MDDSRRQSQEPFEPPEAIEAAASLLDSSASGLAQSSSERKISQTFEIEQETANLESHNDDDKVPDDWEFFPFASLRENEVIEAECALRLKTYQKVKKKAKKNIIQAENWQEKTEVIKRLNSKWKELTPQMFVACITSLGQDSDDFCEALSMSMHCEDWDVKDRKTHLAESLRHMRREPAGVLLVTFADWTDDLGDPPKARQYSGQKRASASGAPRASVMSSVDENANADSLVPSFMARWPRLSMSGGAGSEHANGRLSTANESVRLASSCELHPWGKTKAKNLYDQLVPREKAEYTVHWTALNHIVNPASTRDQVYIVKALADTGSNSHVYNTVIGRVIQETAWNRVKVHFFVNVILEAVYLLCMGFLGASAHREERPSWLLSVLVLSLTFYNVAGKNFLNFALTMRLYGLRAGFWNSMSGWNIFTTVLNCFASVVLVRACFPSVLPNLDHHDCLDEIMNNITGETRNTCYMQRHPVFFAFSTFFKWLEFIISLLCVKSLGIGLIMTPAFHAVSHKESVYFLLVAMLLVLGSWHAYWTFPIPENQEDEAYTMGLPAFSFIKIFRLFLLADFDTYELEGLDPELEGNISLIPQSVNSTDGSEVFGITGSVEDGTLNTKIHWGIQAFFLMSVVAGLIVMNVYIGLLGNLYDEGKRARQQLHQHLKAEYTYKLLLYKEFFPWLPCYWTRKAGPCRRRASDDRQSLSPDGELLGEPVHVPNEVDDRSFKDGVWIAYDDRSFMDKADMDVRIRQIEESLDDVKEIAATRDQNLNAKMDAILAHLQVNYDPPRPRPRRQSTVRF